MNRIFFWCALFVGLPCLGQYVPVGAITMWTDGYVVTHRNDTLRGQVRVGSLVNDSPANIVIRTADGRKHKVNGSSVHVLVQQLPSFAYTTGSIPRERKAVVFERVPNPRHNQTPTLLERLTPPGGRIALYFDAAGWKKNIAYSFGNFSIETNPQDLSYVVLKNGNESLLAKRGDLEAIHERLFGDCPAFIRHYPVATRRDWNRFGDMVSAYNERCSFETVTP